MRRTRKRYFRFKIHSRKGCAGTKSVLEDIWKSLLSIYGEIEAADSKLYMVEFDETTQTGILQCAEPSLHRVIAASALIASIDGRTVSFEPLKTSGTIRSLRQS
ncbi:MAG: Rpp14/Pop5 family protein [Candidatus Thorarchaeota archaeon]|nr:MAG: hypothetical protein DRP09_04455 [Candidatus Thorarchaeota archaeon]RLI59740.1 MAG: hypothetical protein DRO87_02030 [Candidatus Thorarchaeota archaeon]